MHKYLHMAAGIALRGNRIRKAFIGSLGVRRDGCIVTAWNGPADDRKPPAHAEARLARKLDVGSIVYVARVRRDNGAIAIAKPCPRCESALRNRGVKKAYYTINEDEWGCLEF